MTPLRHGIVFCTTARPRVVASGMGWQRCSGSGVKQAGGWHRLHQARCARRGRTTQRAAARAARGPALNSIPHTAPAEVHVLRKACLSLQRPTAVRVCVEDPTLESDLGGQRPATTLYRCLGVGSDTDMQTSASDHRGSRRSSRLLVRVSAGNARG